MYKEYKKIKRNRKRKSKIIKTRYFIFLLLIISIFITVGYSYWSTSITIQGSVTASVPKLEVVVPPPTQVDGVTRYTSNTDMTALGFEIYKVVEETNDQNTITTTIQHIRKQITSWAYVDPTITLKIQNGTNYDYLNGTIELVEYKDDNNIFTNRSQSVTPTNVLAGEEITITISGTLRGNQDVANGTIYKYAISYDVNGEKQYFYYNLIILPI